MQCLCCGSTEGVKLEDSRTCYVRLRPSRYERLMYDDPLNDEPPDPNAPILLCRGCAESHHSDWDAQWAEVYNSRF